MPTYGAFFAESHDQKDARITPRAAREKRAKKCAHKMARRAAAAATPSQNFLYKLHL